MFRLTREERVFFERAGIPTLVEIIGTQFVWRFRDECYLSVVLRSTVGSVQTWEMEGDDSQECIIIVPSAPFLAGGFGDIVGFYFDVKNNQWWAMIPRQHEHDDERRRWRGGTLSFE